MLCAAHCWAALCYCLLLVVVVAEKRARAARRTQRASSVKSCCAAFQNSVHNKHGTCSSLALASTGPNSQRSVPHSLAQLLVGVHSSVAHTNGRSKLVAGSSQQACGVCGVRVRVASALSHSNTSLREPLPMAMPVFSTHCV